MNVDKVRELMTFEYKLINRDLPQLIVVQSPAQVQLCAHMMEELESKNGTPSILKMDLEKFLPELKRKAHDYYTKKGPSFNCYSVGYRGCRAYEVHWIAYYQACLEQGVKVDAKFEEFVKLADEANMFYCLPFAEACIVCGPPQEAHFSDQILNADHEFHVPPTMIGFDKTINIFTDKSVKPITFDERGRLHSTIGPAMTFEDGSGYFFVHDVWFEPEDFAKYFPVRTDLKPEVILKEANTEKRTAIIREYGFDFIFDHLPHKILDQSKEKIDTTNWERRERLLLETDELPINLYEITMEGARLHLLELHDPSPPHKIYMSLVPSECLTVDEARKWMAHQLDVKSGKLVETELAGFEIISGS
jgi:hypothetical protein